jgi:amino acid adenylation domain-containing protein
MDPNDPVERLSVILKDSGVRVLITENELSEKLPSRSVTQVFLDTELKEMPGEEPFTFAAPEPQSLAYVIYTSGSTGKPKGVMITHANLHQYVRSLGDALGIRPQDRWLHTASFGFSSSIRQFLVPLSCGAAVTVASVEQIQDPWALFNLIRRDRVSIIDLVPSHLRVCAHALTRLSGASLEGLQNELRLILSASEALTSDIPRAWARLTGKATTMVNMFGQTETTGIVTVYPITLQDGDTMRNVPIGRPIANSRVYVLDAFRQPVPVGVPGELYVGGSGVGMGYLNQPDLTAERFVADPFRKGSTSRLYRTGDLARYLSDGNLEFLGRTDHQLKIRGFRVEPGEVEAVLALHPLVRECAVVAVSDENGQRLVAHIVATQTSATLIGELRQHLRNRLAHYMVPAAFLELEKLPRTSHGKIDRKALSAGRPASAKPHPVEKIWAVPSAQEPAQPEIQSGFVSPRTAVEKALAGIWTKVLGVERIGIHDNFFDLGGDSLLTTHVVQRAQDEGLPLRIAEVFKHQTIAQLAQATSLKAEPILEQNGELTVSVPVRPKVAFRITAESLMAYGREALETAGLSPEGAAIVTEVQLEASMRGQPTHNIGSIPRYARRIASGRTNPRPTFRIERETAVSALVNGDNGQGQWVAVWAMQLAIRKARENGIGLVGANHSNHFGAAGHYAWLAARENLIGLCTSNAGVWLAPTGGLTPTFGNNPLAVGIPANRSLPIVMDISMSVAAKGKIGLHLAEGNPLPMGWIFDRFGRLSIDPSDLAAGLGVPMGGHKGYGLTVVLETLTGILTGAGFCGDHRRERMRQGAPDLGQLFVAINPELFMPIDQFKKRVDSMVEQVKASERAENVPEILLPGELEMRAREESLLHGVPVLPVTHAALEKYRKAAGLNCSLAFVTK